MLSLAVTGVFQRQDRGGHHCEALQLRELPHLLERQAGTAALAVVAPHPICGDTRHCILDRFSTCFVS